MNLPQGYTLEEIEKDLFFEKVRPLMDEVFKDEPILNLRGQLTHEEAKKAQDLGNLQKDIVKTFLVVKFEGEIVAWSWGFQYDTMSFYMCNSAVLKEHRHKGIYTFISQQMLKKVRELGFQRVFSRHTISNNSIIIAKLKQNFLISSFEVDPAFGTLVHLSYYFKPLFKEIFDYRVGASYPSKEVSKLFL